MSKAATAKKAKKSSVKEAKRALYQTLVMDAAELIFARDGYDTTKVQTIADEAGLSIATLYKLYPSKWEVFRAVHNRHGTALMAIVKERLSEIAKLSPLAMILDGVGMYVAYLLDHPNYLRMHLREGGLWASSGALKSDEQVALWQGGLALVAGIFARAQTVGELLEDDNPDAMGRTMIAMHQARLAMWSEGMEPQDRAELTRSMQRQFVRAFCPRDVCEQWLEHI